MITLEERARYIARLRLLTTSGEKTDLAYIAAIKAMDKEASAAV